ncbi:MAG TPA: hypothetical protein PLN06_01265 [Bacteroidales bacterium]|nr:hypothetical protein [Bacteroidales bacterium]HOU95241.1 hypothetical protein [Bacteroidales bacterium]HQG35577.1 hypothetical protein [Bacteroidales bacterium]HQG51887.1 hypothetical protein [Bacteroidales bacterium]HQJ19582.1 hypothetical protein [Bacteroidales bacterium]
MKKYISYILFIFLAVVFSCDENPLLISCDECSETEPDYATLRIKLDKNIRNEFSPSVVVRIYEGKLEDNILIDSYYVPASDCKINVALNKKYTVTATYTDERGIVYIAVDSAYPRVKYEKTQCKDPCYYVYDKTINLRIKYRN